MSTESAGARFMVACSEEEQRAIKVVELWVTLAGLILQVTTSAGKAIKLRQLNNVIPGFAQYLFMHKSELEEYLYRHNADGSCPAVRLYGRAIKGKADDAGAQIVLVASSTERLEDGMEAVRKLLTEIGAFRTRQEHTHSVSELLIVVQASFRSLWITTR